MIHYISELKKKGFNLLDLLRCNDDKLIYNIGDYSRIISCHNLINADKNIGIKNLYLTQYEKDHKPLENANRNTSNFDVVSVEFKKWLIKNDLNKLKRKKCRWISSILDKIDDLILINSKRKTKSKLKKFLGTNVLLKPQYICF